MKELGHEGPALHEALAAEFENNRIDLLFAAGPLMKNLVLRLSAEKVAAHVDSSDELVDAICAEIRPGDAVMVKGSLSMKMALIVKAIKERYGAGLHGCGAERIDNVNLVG